MKRNYLQIILIGIFSAFVIAGCKKSKEETPAIEHGTLKDVDGNTYQTVKIGDQWWMAEDLRVTKYRDSSFISLVAGPPADTTWKHRSSGAYCNNYDPGGHLIGRFYNYYAVADPRGIALLAQRIGEQAQMLAMIDVFQLITWSFVFMLPLVFLLRRRKPGAAPVQVHAAAE